jgi:hypothetical protein
MFATTRVFGAGIRTIVQSSKAAIANTYYLPNKEWPSVYLSQRATQQFYVKIKLGTIASNNAKATRELPIFHQ